MSAQIITPKQTVVQQHCHARLGNQTAVREMNSQYIAIAQGNSVTTKGYHSIILLRLVAYRDIPWQTLVAAEQQQSLHWLALLLLQLPETERAQILAEIDLILMHNDDDIQTCVQTKSRMSVMAIRFSDKIKTPSRHRRRILVSQARQSYHAFRNCASCLLFGCCLCITQRLPVRKQAGKGVSQQYQPRVTVTDHFRHVLRLCRLHGCILVS